MPSIASSPAFFAPSISNAGTFHNHLPPQGHSRLADSNLHTLAEAANIHLTFRALSNAWQARNGLNSLSDAAAVHTGINSLSHAAEAHIGLNALSAASQLHFKLHLLADAAAKAKRS